MTSSEATERRRIEVCVTAEPRKGYYGIVGQIIAALSSAPQRGAGGGSTVEETHPAAGEHLPAFITGPGQTDVLFVVIAVFLINVVLLVGNFYFRLHALPERMAHRSQKVQFEIVAVLALLALFTHNHLFWIAALLLALVQLPDFSTPIGSMARSLEKLANGDDRRRGELRKQEPTEEELRKEELREQELRQEELKLAPGAPAPTKLEARG